MKLNNRVFAIREYAGIWGAEGERLDVRDPVCAGRGYQGSTGYTGYTGFQGSTPVAVLGGTSSGVVSETVKKHKSITDMTEAEFQDFLKGRTNDFVGPDVSKKSDEENLYVVCRKMLVQCLDNIFSDNIPSLDEVLKQRKIRGDYYQTHKKKTQAIVVVSPKTPSKPRPKVKLLRT
jgi:hypothetical protein